MATFGNDTVNGNGSNNLNVSSAGFNAAAWTGVAPANMGTVISISGVVTGSGTHSFAIWNVSAGTVGTLVANSAISFNAGAGFTTATYGTPPVLVAGNSYAIGYVSGGTGGFYKYTPFTSGGTDPSFVLQNNATGPTPANVIAQDQTAGQGAGFDMSFFVTYTPAVATPTLPYRTLLGVGI